VDVEKGRPFPSENRCRDETKPRGYPLSVFIQVKKNAAIEVVLTLQLIPSGTTSSLFSSAISSS
jgi:hypothetical protein